MAPMLVAGRHHDFGTKTVRRVILWAPVSFRDIDLGFDSELDFC
jgi:hypothetical protein